MSMDQSANEYAFTVSQSVFDALSLFGRSKNSRIYMSCFLYIAGQVESEPSRTVPFDALRNGVSDLLRQFNISEILRDLSEDNGPVLADEDISSPEKKRFATSYRILNLLENRGLIKTVMDYDDTGRNLVSYVHIRSIGRELLTFLKNTAELDKPSFNARNFLSMSGTMKGVYGRPEDAQNYDKIDSVYVRFKEELNHLDNFADEFADFVQEYQNRAKRGEHIGNADWVNRVFNSEYFKQYIMISQSSDTRFGYLVNLRKVQSVSRKLLKEENRQILDEIVRKKIDQDRAMSVFNPEVVEESDHDLYIRLNVGIREKLSFLGYQAVKQYNRRSERIRNEVGVLIGNVRECVNNLSMHGMRLSISGYLNRMFQYLNAGNEVDGIVNLIGYPGFHDECSLKVLETFSGGQSDKIEIRTYNDEEVPYDDESDITAVNMIMRKVFQSTSQCHIRDILSLDPDRGDYKWGVVETLNRILYYGHFGRQDLQAENPDAGVCYYLVQNGVGTVVRETEDGSYLYPDVMIAAVEDREDG